MDLMYDWASQEGRVDPEVVLTEGELLWDMSGVPAIFSAISERICEGNGQELLTRVQKSAINLANGLNAAHQVVSRREADKALPPLAPGQLDGELARLEGEALQAMDAVFETAIGDYHKRLERSHRSFLERATGSLLKHLDEYGDEEVWEYDPSGLRILLRTAYQVFGRNAQKGTKKVMIETAESYAAIYHRLFEVDDENFGIEAPSAPRIPSPVLLGQTIALDLKGTWWSRWWHKRRGYRSFATEFADMIKAETAPIVDSLSGPHADAIRDASIATLKEFFAEQRSVLESVAAEAAAGNEERASNMIGDSGTAEKRAQLQQAMVTLTGKAA